MCVCVCVCLHIHSEDLVVHDLILMCFGLVVMILRPRNHA